MPAGGYPSHDCTKVGLRRDRVQAAIVQAALQFDRPQGHVVISGALATTVRWGWIVSNPRRRCQEAVATGSATGTTDP
jgi:hypothetical protein